MSQPGTDIAGERIALVQQAFELEYLTLGWLAVEAVVAIVSGLAAKSLALTAFGIDSLIELASATVVLWRLTIELRQGEAFAEDIEKAAARAGALLLFALAAYLVAGAAWKLATRHGAEFSFLGLTISALAIPVMLYLSRRKLQLAEALGSRALRTDAMESLACGALAIVVIVALLAQIAIGAWWVDALASLTLAWLLIREGREAWESEADED
ncbi:MAG TPA: cation transporter [Pseudolabrys sp.]|nr:cation transporter [Pseudolabrys sp.]